MKVVICKVGLGGEVGGGVGNDAQTTEKLFGFVVEFLLCGFREVDFGGGGEVVVFGDEEGVVGSGSMVYARGRGCGCG